MAKLNRWEITASSGSHFDVLDGLRGVAILLVVANHTLYTNPEHGLAARLAGYLFQGGGMGVMMFFVLSGFLISYPFFQKRHQNPQYTYQRGYAWRRAAKILPPFYLSLVLFVGFYWWRFHDPAYLHDAWQWASGQGLGGYAAISPRFNTVYWSLMVESQYYLVLPLLFWLTRGQSVRKTGTFMFLLFFTVPLVFRQLWWPENTYELPYEEMALSVRCFPCCLDYFAWGILFASVYVPLTAEKPAGLRPLCVFGYAGVGLMLAFLIYWGLWKDLYKIQEPRWGVEMCHLLPGAATLLMLFFVFDPQSLGARLLSMGWLRLVGIVSYEWFLFHLPITKWFHEQVGPSHGSLMVYAWRTIAPLAVTFGCSVLVYRYFSLPIIKWTRDRLKAGAPAKS